MLKLYLRLGVPTIVICAIAAAGLAATYAFTKDRIAAQDKAAQEKALFAVLPDAKSFKEVTDKGTLASAVKASPDTPVKALFQALDSSGEVTGWGVVSTPRGYGGPMTMAVGVDRNGKVTGVNIVIHNETPGLGTKAVANKDFLGRFTGAESAEKAVKLDGITGATKSSRGVKRGVEAALLVYDKVLKGLKGGASQ
jgi:electron transport complex protein RnfG